MRRGVIHSLEVGRTVDDPEVLDTTPVWSYLERSPGIVLDAYTGLPLPAEGVQAARKEELELMQRLDVWYLVPLAEARSDTGRDPFRVMWVDCNKGIAIILNFVRGCAFKKPGG